MTYPSPPRFLGRPVGSTASCIGGGSGSGPGAGRARRRPASRSSRCRDQAARGGVRVHRDRAIAALDDRPAAGRRRGHAHLRQVGRPRAAGTPLVQIDPDKQQATVRSTEAQRAGARGGRRSTGAAGRAPADAGRRPARSASQEFDQAQTTSTAAQAQARRRSTRRCAKAGAAPVLPRHRAARPASSATSPSAKAIASRPSTMITTIDDNERARGVHPGAARARAGAAGRAAGASCSTPTARSSRPTRSPSSRRASTRRRSRSWSRACCKDAPPATARAAVRARADRLAHGAGADGAGRRGRCASAASTSSSSPSRQGERPGRPAAAGRRSARSSATTTSSRAA